MRCYACDDGLPTDNNNNLDPETGRFYCSGCGQEINNLYEEMYMRSEASAEGRNEDGTPKKPESTLLDGEVETLDEEFDELFLSDYDVQTDEDFEDLNLPSENYDE